MSTASRRLAGLLLILLPAVIVGGASILAMIDNPEYRNNELRQDLWRAGHAHAGVLLVLALVALRYVDECELGPRWRAFARHSIPASAILLPVAFFCSVTDADATEPNLLINLAYVGAAILTAGLLVARRRTAPHAPLTTGARALVSSAGSSHSPRPRGRIAAAARCHPASWTSTYLTPAAWSVVEAFADLVRSAEEGVRLGVRRSRERASRRRSG